MWWGTLRIQFGHVKFEVPVWYSGDLELAGFGDGIFESHQRRWYLKAVRLRLLRERRARSNLDRERGKG